jgi:hypothetical protein
VWAEEGAIVVTEKVYPLAVSVEQLPSDLKKKSQWSGNVGEGQCWL